VKCKRLKNRDLKHRHIWPRILAMLIMLAVFVAIDAGLVYLYLQSMVGNKILEGYQKAQKVILILEDSKGERRAFEEGINDMERILPEISSVVVADEDNNILERFGEDTPDFSQQIPFVFSGTEFTIIPEGNDFILKNGKSIPDIEEMLERANPNVMIFPERGNVYKWAGESFAGINCWYVSAIEGSNNRICVRGKVDITVFEIYSLAAVFFFAIFIAIVIFFWQLISLIRMFADHYRAFRIIHSDMVTGGNNKHMFIEASERLVKRRRGRQYAVVQLRVEKYRSYCMYYGDDAGEKLLSDIYMAAEKIIGRKEFLAHEGEGIYALLVIYEDEISLTKWIKSLCSKLDGLRPDQKMYFSAGICKAENHKNIAEYYIDAGVARATIKEDDEERVAWFNEEMRAAQIWERKVEDDMERALANNEFQVYLQPKYSTRDEVLSGAEALIRWIHPTEGFISPGRFIPIFEKNGFILKIDDFMITQVSRLQSQWLSEGKKVVPISVNVSRAHFTREDLAEHICKIVDSYNVPHEYIELELTESAFFDDKEVLLRTVKKMKDFGFHVSMDDFGAGYSSLNSLKELPLDVVKLDAEFFRGADDFDRANLIVSRTIGLAKQLGMTIVAEGIETREQVDFLAGQDCDLIQGFYFAKPMPVNDFVSRAFDGVEEDISN